MVRPLDFLVEGVPQLTAGSTGVGLFVAGMTTQVSICTDIQLKIKDPQTNGQLQLR
jgi:hypothetical protein